MTTRPATATISVVVDDRHHDDSVAADALERLLAAVLADQGVAGPAEVGLSFVGTDEMAELNQTHMGKAGPTDVLAFPIDGAAPAPEGQVGLVGDIVICPIVAARADQAVEAELELLVVHGALHLLGHDHAEPDETEVMQGLERSLLDRFGR